MCNYSRKYRKVAKQQSQYRDLENRLPDSVHAFDFALDNNLHVILSNFHSPSYIQ